MVSQFQLLNKILQTKDFSLITMNNLTEDFFYNYVAEFRYIKAHYDEYNVVPDRLTFVNMFQDFEIQDIDEPDTYLLEQLYNDYNAKVVGDLFNNAKALVEKGQAADALAVINKTMEKCQTKTAMTCVDLFKDTGRYDRYLERTHDRANYYFSTGFRELDEIIGGIDRENENMVIAARTGIGKTWTLIKMAVAVATQRDSNGKGRNVGIYSGEMTADKVGYRVDTLLGRINNNAITRGDAFVNAAYKKYIEHDLKTMPGSIKVITPADINGPATVQALRAFIEKYDLDILFVDQYSLLEDVSRAKAMHERVANISKDIKNLQVLKKIPIISVSQMNRTKNDDGSQDTTQIGLTDRIGQDATVIIMLDRKEIEGEDKASSKHQLILNVVKSRDGGDGRKLTYDADFNTGRFTCVDGANGNTATTQEECDAMASSYDEGVEF